MEKFMINYNWDLIDLAYSLNEIKDPKYKMEVLESVVDKNTMFLDFYIRWLQQCLKETQPLLEYDVHRILDLQKYLDQLVRMQEEIEEIVGLLTKCLKCQFEIQKPLRSIPWENIELAIENYDNVTSCKFDELHKASKDVIKQCNLATQELRKKNREVWRLIIEERDSSDGREADVSGVEGTSNEYDVSNEIPQRKEEVDIGEISIQIESHPRSPNIENESNSNQRYHSALFNWSRKNPLLSSCAVLCTICWFIFSYRISVMLFY